MSNPDPKTIVERFNECINKRDIEGLADLMTDDHVFVDASDEVHRGKQTMIQAWSRFFEQFPDYRNDFHVIQTTGNNVFIVGRSNCSFKPLDGPALWTARIMDGCVAEWRVYLDTNKNRKRLNLKADSSSL
jgi:uncharacterized protein (TIGR02246 family)